jgi:hypothetical protein
MKYTTVYVTTELFLFSHTGSINYEINSPKSYSCYTLVRFLHSLVAKDLEMLMKLAERLEREGKYPVSQVSPSLHTARRDVSWHRHLIAEHGYRDAD